MSDPALPTGPAAKTLYRRMLISGDTADVQLTFEPSLLDRYRDAGHQLKRTNTVGRVKASSWSIDFGIGSGDATIHAGIAALLRLPEAERQHWAIHLAEPALSENYLKRLLHRGSCIDDGDTRDW